MSDSERVPAAATTTTAEKRPQDRSPSFPYIGLSKAIERAQQLYGYASRHEARIIDASKPAWNLGAKSSSTLQTVAALLSFGLIEDNGSGENRRIKLSDIGYRAVADPRPGAKEQALADVALKPKLISEMWAKWGTQRPPEAICVGDLTIDRGFTADGANAFLRVYDDTVRYVLYSQSDKQSDSDDPNETPAIASSDAISVGDWVQLEVGGQIIAEKAIVRAIQEHEGFEWVFVEGTETGVLISDVTLLEKASSVANMPITPPKIPLLLKNYSLPSLSGNEEMDQFTVDEGVVKIIFPSGMTEDSIDDLESFFELFIKKTKRRAAAG